VRSALKVRVPATVATSSDIDHGGLPLGVHSE
jgi:hypothetical protein